MSRRGFFNFVKMNQHKRKSFIFDLDRTLWDFTVEYCLTIKVAEIHNYVHSSRLPILKTLQNEGHSLNIASRSKEEKKCTHMLNEAFPTIHFSNKQIFFTESEQKRTHINNILRSNGEYDEHTQNPEDFFYLFDDEKVIVNDTNRAFETKQCFHTPLGLNYGVFDIFK